MHSFELASRLQADCEFVLDWPLCRVLLMRDARYPWFILVPRREGLRELCELASAEEQQYLLESRQLSAVLLKEFQADKLNIAALGNVEPQLHIHHIARYTSDPAWPAPVWGALPAEPYPSDQLQQRLQLSRRALQALPV